MNLIQSYRTLKEYRSDPLGFVVKMHLLKGHRIHLKIFGKELFIISHPDDVLHVLKNNANSYTKGRTTKALRQFLGNGLITNEGSSWRKQHRFIRPMMNPKSILALAPKILATTSEFIPELCQKKNIDVFHEMNRLTWRIVLKALFSLEVSSEMDDWLEDILDLMRIITSTTRSSLPLPFWVPTKNHRRMKKILKKFDETVYRMIRDRRKASPQDDLLQLLIDTKEEGLSQLSDLEIRDEIMTFMMAGHETITNSMTWTLIELAKNSAYIPKLREEALEFFQDKNFEALQNFPWHSAIMDEVMRLWPAVWVFMRQAQVEDRLGDVLIPPKANVVLAPYLSQRSQDFWKNPEVFYPERFLPENKKEIPSGAYYPFGMGPRACIGAYFATMEAKIILASLVHNFDWSIQDPAHQRHEAGISLRPLNNILMTFRSRT
jgi:cytochrome P450